MRYWMFIFAVAAITLLIDQLSKFYIQRIMLLNQSAPIIPGIFQITYTKNTGTAFGLFANQTIFFVAITLIVIAIILIYLRKVSRGRQGIRTALALILGGALGNLTDRIRVGAVIDFLDFRVWPVFNIADSAISIGAVFLFISIVRRRKAEV